MGRLPFDRRTPIVPRIIYSLFGTDPEDCEGILLLWRLGIGALFLWPHSTTFLVSPRISAVYLDILPSQHAWGLIYLSMAMVQFLATWVIQTRGIRIVVMSLEVTLSGRLFWGLISHALNPADHLAFATALVFYPIWLLTGFLGITRLLVKDDFGGVLGVH